MMKNGLFYGPSEKKIHLVFFDFGILEHSDYVEIFSLLSNSFNAHTHRI